MDYKDAIELTKGKEGLICKVHTKNYGLFDGGALYMGTLKSINDQSITIETEEGSKSLSLKLISNIVF